ncbi:MAG: 4-phosphopantetheinyl transferase family protein [Muribaculaceae bacterium]|nr:4-phosphopantetheinyl transferase family protein [Muribaculaceae bacterium]
MDEKFPDEFVTWRHNTPIGVKVDEVFGMDSKSGKVWQEMARQIFCEQGEPNYRIISHFADGAPFIEGYPGRISLTHTDHFFAVAWLPKTPEVSLEVFTPRAAMGIDAEFLHRQQVLKIRQKFLSDQELEMIPADNVEKNIQAWTAKEALYKAALSPGLDFRKDIHIVSLPEIEVNLMSKEQSTFGEAELYIPEVNEKVKYPMRLYSYISYSCCVTIAVSPKSAKFGK